MAHGASIRGSAGRSRRYQYLRLPNVLPRLGGEAVVLDLQLGRRAGGGTPPP